MADDVITAVLMTAGIAAIGLVAFLTPVIIETPTTTRVEISASSDAQL